jgi:hypothetical protein
MFQSLPRGNCRELSVILVRRYRPTNLSARAVSQSCGMRNRPACYAAELGWRKVADAGTNLA